MFRLLLLVWYANSKCFGHKLFGFWFRFVVQMAWSLSAGTADSACIEGLLHNVGYPPRKGAELSGHLACPPSAGGLADFLLTIPCKIKPAPSTRVRNPTWDLRPSPRKLQLQVGIPWDLGLVPGHAPCARYPATCKVIMLGLHWECINVHLCIPLLLDRWRDKFFAFARGTFLVWRALFWRRPFLTRMSAAHTPAEKSQHSPYGSLLAWGVCHLDFLP